MNLLNDGLKFCDKGILIKEYKISTKEYN